MKVVENVVVLIYVRICPYGTFNECHRYLFTKFGHMIDNCISLKKQIQFGQHYQRSPLKRVKN